MFVTCCMVRNKDRNLGEWRKLNAQIERDSKEKLKVMHLKINQKHNQKINAKTTTNQLKQVKRK